ncbi:MAG: DUF4340 domain-containing protein, partial [Flammeovirgaceae bacterium]|nr:DUF4340 domain-containing protein [Flammeovirgaceae bacterium]
SAAYVLMNQSESQIEIDKTIFQVEDWNMIDRVVLKSGEKEVSLAYRGSRWKVNDSWNADRNMIDILFATLQQVQPMRPVAKNSNDSLAQELKKMGVLVQLFKKGQNSLSFYAGGNARKSQAYFLKNDDTQVYVMQIPGYRVYASGVLEMDEGGWRDKFVFGFNWRNFKGLKTEFQDAKNNFNVSMQEEFFGIEGMKDADTTRLNDYLDAVSLLTVDQYLEKSSVNYDSMIAIKPAVTIKVQDIGGNEYSLSILLSGPESDEAFGIINNTEAALINKRKLGLFMMPRDAFKARK